MRLGAILFLLLLVFLVGATVILPVEIAKLYSELRTSFNETKLLILIILVFALTVLLFLDGIIAVIWLSILKWMKGELE